MRSPGKPSPYETGTCAKRLSHYMYHLQNRPRDNNIEYWRNFVNEYFAPTAKKRWCIYGNGHRTTGVFPQDVWHCEICNRKPGRRGFETTVEVLPRLFQNKYASGTLEELLYIDVPGELRNPSGQVVLDYTKAIQESVFEQLRVVREGHLRIVYNPDLKIASWEFCALRHEEFIPRRSIIPQVSQLGAVVQKYQAAAQNPTNLSTQEMQNNCNSFRCIGHHGILERMLIDEKAEPTYLPLSLLENITNCFSPDHEIGSGGSAVVYMGKVENGMVAVKKLTRTIDVALENKFHKEVECLIKAKHKNIVRFLGYCSEAHGRVEDFEGKFVMADRRNWLLCFEHVPNGSLKKYITDASSGLEWKERFQIIRGICEGLNYLHMNRILHLDLKPANILLDGHMVPKIADFGISRSLEEEKTHGTTKHLSGTPGYLAPEFYGGMFMFASDIYSLGVIIMEILTGLKGYPEDENVTNIWMNRLEGDTELKQVKVCTKIGIECMESDPKKRPVAQHIIDMLDKTTNAYETGSSSSFVDAFDDCI